MERRVDDRQVPRVKTGEGLRGGKVDEGLEVGDEDGERYGGREEVTEEVHFGEV